MAAAVRKVPLRKCTGCGEMMPKKEMLRILLTPEGYIELDETGKRNGRGAYICRNKECLLRAQKIKGLEKSLKCSIPDDVIKEISEKYEWN